MLNLVKRDLVARDSDGSEVANLKNEIVQLQVSLRRFEAFYNRLPTPMSYMNRELQYVAVNDAFLHGLRDFERSEVIGRHYAEVRNRETVETFQPLLARALAGEHGFVEWMPVFGRSGRRWLRTDFYPDFDAEGMVAGIYVMATDIHDLKTSSEMAKVVARRDTLTELPNRLALAEIVERALERCVQSSDGFAILFIDLDEFKIINDNYGHRFGDSVLCAAARRMSGVMRAPDTLARIAGDEFMALIDDSTPDRVRQIAHRLLQTLREPMQIENQTIQLTASVGIAMSPTDGATFDALFRASDRAMYAAKAKGKDALAFFDSH